MIRRIIIFISLLVLAGVAMATILPMLIASVQNDRSSTTDRVTTATSSPFNSTAPARDADERNLPVWINYYNTCCVSKKDPSHKIRFGDWTYPLDLPRPHEYVLGTKFELPYKVKWYNQKKTNIFQFAQPDSYVIGGAPTGGLTYGWGLPETYAGDTTRQIILNKPDHTNGIYTPCDLNYGSDISVENAPLDFVPVYSTLVGTVVEVMGATPDVAADPTCPAGVTNCHPYGNFVRTRNARWETVNASPLYNDLNACDLSNRFAKDDPHQETPHPADKLSCINSKQLTDDECRMDCIRADFRTESTECERTPIYQTDDDPMTPIDERTVPKKWIDCDPCNGYTQYGDGPWQGCGTKAEDICFSYYCIEKTTNTLIAPAYRMITAGLPASVFRNKRLGEPPYGSYRDHGDEEGGVDHGVGVYIDMALVHETNFEVVQANLTNGSVDKFVTARDTTLDNDMQIGVLGNSGYYWNGTQYQLNSKRPMMHYEVWKNGGGAFDPPDTLVLPWPSNTVDQPQVTIGNADPPLIPTIYNHADLPNVCREEPISENVLANIDNSEPITAHCELVDKNGNIIVNEFDIYSYTISRAGWQSFGGIGDNGFIYESATYIGMKPQLFWKIIHTVGESRALMSIFMGSTTDNYASHRQYLYSKETGPFGSSAGPLEVDQLPVIFDFSGVGTCNTVTINPTDSEVDTYLTQGINELPALCLGKYRTDYHPQEHKLKSGYIDCNCNPNQSCSCSGGANACYPPGSGGGPPTIPTEPIDPNGPTDPPASPVCTEPNSGPIIGFARAQDLAFRWINANGNRVATTLSDQSSLDYLNDTSYKKFADDYHGMTYYSIVRAEAAAKKINQAFALMIWFNESNASNSNLTYEDFGIHTLDGKFIDQANPDHNFYLQIKGFFNLGYLYDTTSWTCDLNENDPMLHFCIFFRWGSCNADGVEHGRGYLESKIYEWPWFAPGCCFPSKPTDTSCPTSL